MSRHMVFAAAAAALMVSAAACSRDATSPEPRQLLTGPITRIDTLRGTIRPNGDDAVSSTDVVLITTEGNEVKLLGPVAELLRDAGAADVWVAGEFTAANEM